MIDLGLIDVSACSALYLRVQITTFENFSLENTRGSKAECKLASGFSGRK
jgi:hypothetical protein